MSLNGSSSSDAMEQEEEVLAEGFGGLGADITAAAAAAAENSNQNAAAANITAAAENSKQNEAAADITAAAAENSKQNEAAADITAAAAAAENSNQNAAAAAAADRSRRRLCKPKPTTLTLLNALNEPVVVSTCTSHLKLMQREARLSQLEFTQQLPESVRRQLQPIALPLLLCTPCQRYWVAIVDYVPRAGVQRHDHAYFKVVSCPPEEECALLGPHPDARTSMAHRYTWDNAHELLMQTIVYKKTSSAMQQLYVPWMVLQLAGAAAAADNCMVLRNLSVQWLTKRWGGPGFMPVTSDARAQALLAAKTWTLRHIVGGFRRTPNSQIHSLQLDMSLYDTVKHVGGGGGGDGDNAPDASPPQPQQQSQIVTIQPTSCAATIAAAAAAAVWSTNPPPPSAAADDAAATTRPGIAKSVQRMKKAPRLPTPNPFK